MLVGRLEDVLGGATMPRPGGVFRLSFPDHPARRTMVRSAMSSPPGPLSQLDQLEARIGSSWQSVRKARIETQSRRDGLATEFAQYGSPDTSLVVFGSVARQEVTSGSDLDWILLIDGQSVPEHRIKSGRSSAD
jgi:hypothetical protein